jgi:hypothetical protein
VLVQELHKGRRDELASVVRAQHLRTAALEGLLERVDDLERADRAVDTTRDALACELVDDVEDPDCGS